MLLQLPTNSGPRAVTVNAGWGLLGPLGTNFGHLPTIPAPVHLKQLGCVSFLCVTSVRLHVEESRFLVGRLSGPPVIALHVRSCRVLLPTRVMARLRFLPVWVSVVVPLPLSRTTKLQNNLVTAHLLFLITLMWSFLTVTLLHLIAMILLGLSCGIRARVARAPSASVGGWGTRGFPVVRTVLALTLVSI